MIEYLIIKIIQKLNIVLIKFDHPAEYMQNPEEDC